MSLSQKMSASARMESAQALLRERLNCDHIMLHDENGASVEPKKIYKAVIFPTLHILGGLDAQTRHEVCFHISAGYPAETVEAKEALFSLGYKSGKSAGERAIKEIIDSCLVMTSDKDNPFVFNEVVITAKLAPVEIEMMRAGETNMQSYLARQGQMAVREAQITRSVVETGKPVEYVRPESDHRILHETKPGLHPQLVEHYKSIGVSPQRMEDFYNNKRLIPEQRKPDFIFMAPNQPGIPK